MREVQKPRETGKNTETKQYPEQILGGAGIFSQGIVFLRFPRSFCVFVGFLEVWVTCPFPEYMGMVYCVLF